MKAWVFDYLVGVSDSYHSGGGLLVIAESPQKAKALIESRRGTNIRGEYGPAVDIDINELDFRQATASFPVEAEPQLFIFPDAGCC
jgi:hypothetical protein